MSSIFKHKPVKARNHCDEGIEICLTPANMEVIPNMIIPGDYTVQCASIEAHIKLEENSQKYPPIYLELTLNALKI